MIKTRKTVESLLPYVPGKPIDDVKREFDLDVVIKLASNENPYGCSPLAKQAMQEAFEDMAIYPDGNATVLKNAVAQQLQVSSDQLLFGSGSDEIITMLSQVFINPGDEVISCQPSFPRYKSSVQLMDGHYIEVPAINHTFDVKGIVDAITDKTKMIFIANPNNPTGTIISAEEQQYLLDNVPPHIVIILDEAYYEYAKGGTYPNSIPLLNQYENIIILRTFSKAYGLASLRVGYAVSNANLISYLNRVRGPFNVNSLAQVAAIAALDDQEFIEKTVSLNKEVKEYTYKECERLNIPHVKSHTNFVMMKLPDTGESFFIALQKKGIIIRPLGATNFVRVTLGTKEQMVKFFAEIQELL